MGYAEPMEETVLIYAIGSDSRLREMCWDLLEQKRVERADLLERANLFLKEGWKRKTAMSGRAVTILCQRDRVEEVFEAMKNSYRDGDLEAWALPVVARLS